MGGIAGDIHVDDIPVNLSQCLYYAVLSVGKVEVLAVVPLRILIFSLVETAEEHYVVDRLGSLYGVSNELLSRTAFCEILPCGHSVELASDIAYISTLIANLHAILLKTRLETVERSDLALYLQ